MKLLIDISEEYYKEIVTDRMDGSHLAPLYIALITGEIISRDKVEDDAISRHVVLETIDSRIEQIKRDANKINKSYSHLSFAEGVHDGYCRLKCDLRILPSVIPHQKTGHWITDIKSDLRGDMWPTNPKCSECGGEPYYSNTIYNYKFCPYCGARMVEPQERKGKDKE